MSDRDENLSPDERAIAGALGGLTAAPPRREVAHAVWYQAGLKAGRRRAGVWRAATVAATLVAGASLGWSGRSAAGVERVVYVDRTPAPAPAALPEVGGRPVASTNGQRRATVVAASSSTFLRLQAELAQDGLDALPPTSAKAWPGRSSRGREGSWPSGPYPFLDGG